MFTCHQNCLYEQNSKTLFFEKYCSGQSKAEFALYICTVLFIWFQSPNEDYYKMFLVSFSRL